MSARLIRYTLDGIKLTHDISFGVTDGDGFDVYINRTKLDKDLDYDVIGSVEELREGDGKITLKAAHAASDVLLILSDTLARRVTNFAKAARFEEAEIDNEFDNLLRLLEDSALNLQSTPYFSPPDIGLVNGELPALIAGGVLRVNEHKNGFELVELDKVPEFQEVLRKATEQADKAESEAGKAESAEQSARRDAEDARASKDSAAEDARKAEDAATKAKGYAVNLLSNHDFLIQTPDNSQPRPDAVPRNYPAGYQVFSGVFACESAGVAGLTYVNGRPHWNGGGLCFSVANAGALKYLTDFVASVADFGGEPRTRGVSFGLVGNEYRVTVGVDALEDASANATPLGSVKFEQGSVATGHAARGLFDIYGDPNNSEIVNMKSLGLKVDGSPEDPKIILDALERYDSILIPSGVLAPTGTIELDNSFNGKTVYCHAEISGSNTPSGSSGVSVRLLGDDNKWLGGTIRDNKFYSIDNQGKRNRFYFLKSFDGAFSAINDGSNAEDSIYREIYAEGHGWDLAQNGGKRAKWYDCIAKSTGRHGYSTDVNSSDTEFHNCLAVDVGGSDLIEGQDSYHFEGTSGTPLLVNCKALYTSSHRAITNPSSLQYLKGFLSVDSNSKVDGLTIDISPEVKAAINAELGRNIVSVQARVDAGISSTVSIGGLVTSDSIISYYGNDIDLTIGGESKLDNVEFVKLFLQPAKLTVKDSVLNGDIAQTLTRNTSSLSGRLVRYRNTNVSFINNDISGYGKLVNCVNKNVKFLNNTRVSATSIALDCLPDTSNAAFKNDGLTFRGNTVGDVTAIFLKEAQNDKQESIIIDGNRFIGSVPTVREANFSQCRWSNNTASDDFTYVNLETGNGSINLNDKLYSAFDAIAQGTTTASPVGARVPVFVGQEVLDTTNVRWWKSTGLTANDWV